MKVSELPKYRSIEVKKLVSDVKTLDMGGADGWLISQAISPKKVTVIDLDKKALKKNPCLKKIYGDLTKNKIKKESFPQVTLFEVIEHIKNKEDRIKIFSEAYRVLTPKGKFIISTPNYHRFSTILRSFFWKKRIYPYAVAGGNGIPYTDWHYFEYSTRTIFEDLRMAGFKKIRTYARFLQIPYFQNFFNIESKYGLVLFTVAEK